MTSIFAPIDYHNHPLPLKVSFSAQEWCGHVFMQLNLKELHYRVENRSYFETESDSTDRVDAIISEDSIWTTIRISPNNLPTGEFDVLPSALYTRLLHKPFEAQRVTANITPLDRKSLEGGELLRYEINFNAAGRILRIDFEGRFPYRIQGWTDRYASIFGGEPLTTQAIRTHTIMTDYWNKNRRNDKALLKKLGLEGIGE